MVHVPINAVTWTVGALAVWAFVPKSWVNYRRTMNPLARMYSILAATFGFGLFFLGVPALFTQDTHILRYTYFAADFFVQLSMQIQVWLMWFIGLRNRVGLRWLLLATIPFSAVLLTSEVLTSRVDISYSPYLVEYSDKPLTLILKSVIYLAIALPLGYFLIRQAPRQLSVQAKAKTFLSGMMFVVIALAATSNNVFDNGSDTAGSATVLAVLFLIFLVAELVRPPSKPSNPPAVRPN